MEPAGSAGSYGKEGAGPGARLVGEVQLGLLHHEAAPISRRSGGRFRGRVQVEGSGGGIRWRVRDMWCKSRGKGG